MTLNERAVDFYRRNRPGLLPREARLVTGRAPRTLRCPDCGKRWPREESEAAFQHVLARCPERQP